MDLAGFNRLLRYALSILLVGMAAVLTWWLGPQVVGLTPLFFAAVMLSAWFGGLGPGLLATALAGVVSSYVFADPPFSILIEAEDVVREIVFVSVALLISYLNSVARRTEAKLRQANAVAEQASQAKDRFLAVLSHELRNPLNPVLTAASLHERDPSLPPGVREDLGMIRRNVELEARLIDDLLDLNRISSGKLAMQFEPLDLHALMHDVIHICKQDLETRDIRLVVHPAASRPTVRGDATRLRQVIWNLLRNSAKFTPPGGLITLATRDLPEGQIELSVSDSGIGIGPEALPHIFEPFHQGSESVTRRYGGLGLGLTISRMLIDAHGGSIEAASEGRDRGATFTIRMETAAEQPVEDHPDRLPGAAEGESRRLRILLVEDEEDTRRIMSKLLRKRHDVCVAGSVNDALLVAEDHVFDLLIADLGLPDGSGLELMRRLRRQQALVGIALTGYGMPDDIVDTRQAGFSEHLTKPVDLQRLEAAIQRVACEAVA
jgi:signal transduction histidine kinase